MRKTNVRFAATVAVAILGLVAGAAFAAQGAADPARETVLSASAESAAGASALPAGVVVSTTSRHSGANLPHTPTAVLYDNGPLVTHPGGGAGGADASALQTALGMGTYGFGHAVSSGFRVADDFTVPTGGWMIQTITFFAYQTGSGTTSSINHINLRIWDGVPGAAGSNIVFGDTTTNLLSGTSWSNDYRVLDTGLTNADRPVMADVATVGVLLNPGTYWLDWQTGGTLGSGPWAPPVSILGLTGKPGGNALQYDPTAAVWNPVVDISPQDFPFVIEGNPADFLMEKTVGTVPAVCATTDSVTVNSNTTVYYCYHVENLGAATYNYHNLVDDQLGTLLNNFPQTLPPGGTFDYIVSDVATATVTNTATWTAMENQAGYVVNDTIPYNFEDISGTGTTLTLGDDEVSGPIPMGFNFPYYGTDYTDIYVSSNGFLTVLPGQPNGCCTGGPLPSPTTPNGTISAWWEDMYPPGGGTIKYQMFGSSPNRYFIVQFTNIPHFSSGNLVTYQYKLFEGTGTIQVHYQAAPSDGGTHSAGMENEDGTLGNQYYLGTASLVTPLAVQYALEAGATAVGTDSATVNIADPDIVADPSSVDIMQPEGAQVTLQENILNNGIADLFWTIDESSLAARGPIRNEAGAKHVWLHQFRAGTRPAPNPVSAGSHSFSGVANPTWGKVATPTVPESPDATITITHSTTQNIVSGNSVACNNGVAHTNNSYIRVFDLASFGIVTPFDITDVSIGIEQATSGSGSQPGTMNLYLWNPADPFLFANFSLIGTAPATVSDQSLTIIDVPVAATAPAGSTLVVEFFTPDGNAGGNLLFVGSNADGQTGPTYLAAADCGVPEPTDVGVLGFPGMMLVMNVTGNTGCDVVDLPWLTLSTTAGTTPAGASSQVGMTFNSTGLTPGGTYAGSICISSNDPDSSTVRVPLTLQVDSMPFLDGFETGDTSRWSSVVP